MQVEMVKMVESVIYNDLEKDHNTITVLTKLVELVQPNTDILKQVELDNVVKEEKVVVLVSDTNQHLVVPIGGTKDVGILEEVGMLVDNDNLSVAGEAEIIDDLQKDPSYQLDLHDLEEPFEIKEMVETVIHY